MADDYRDAELIARLRKRDSAAVAALYDGYGRVVYSLLLRITRDQSAAEDLLQELFLRIWNRAREFDESKGSLGVWILSIARNMAIDHVRSAEAHFSSRLRPLEQAERTQAAGAGKPETVLDHSRAIQAGFEQLSFNQKRVVELAYFEGLSQTEIAARLNEPLGTVKSWMRSALLRLRKAIKESAVL